MDEVKFRAWDGSEMFYDDIYCNDSTSSCYIGLDGKIRENGDGLERDDLFTLMQYTGIKDKNGKEIYEGDIIKKDGKNWKLYRDEYGMYKLEGRDNGGERDDWDDNPFLKFSEAVGNIYENPELLNNN